jgi:hypothetical protein
MSKKRNADIYRDLNSVTLLDYLENYRRNWTIYLHLICTYRNPRQVNNYRFNGKRSSGRPNKRWNETVTELQANTFQEEEDSNKIAKQ